MITNPKFFRLRKLTLFPTLDKSRLYLFTETDNGYICKISDKEWIGFPKSMVECQTKLFSLYSRSEHKMVNLAKKQKNGPHYQGQRKKSAFFKKTHFQKSPNRY